MVTREEEGMHAMQCTAMRVLARESTRTMMFTIVVRERVQGSGLLQPSAASLACRAETGYDELIEWMASVFAAIYEQEKSRDTEISDYCRQKNNADEFTCFL